MGMDISMFIVKDKQVLAEDIFDGRNSEWFGQMAGEDNEYAHLHTYYNFEACGNTPDNLLKQYTKPLEDDEVCYYFNHRSIMVDEFLEWFVTYHPELRAGWVHVYDEWAYKTKHIEPQEHYDCLCHYLLDEYTEKDFTFLAWEDKSDCSRWLANWLIENDIPKDAWIVYCFDN